MYKTYTRFKSFYFSLSKNLFDIDLNETILSVLLITIPFLSVFGNNSDLPYANFSNLLTVSGSLKSSSKIGTVAEVFYNNF